MNRVAATICHSSDQVLDQLLDELTNRIHAGEHIDVEACLAAHPEYADRLARLLPAMQVLMALGGSQLATVDGPTSSLAATPISGVLGDFRIVRELGRGGMGVVYEAEQISIGRPVALKVLPFASMLDERRLARFRNEVRAAGQLHHTHIVPVFAVGSDRGVHFYAMQLVTGQTLAEIIADLARVRQPATDAVTPASLSRAVPASGETARAALSTLRTSGGAAFYRTAAELAVQAAEALEHAHSSGVVHRDVKPSNLMVDEGGCLWLTDFGLASVESGTDLTLSGDLLGTLRYMSPEQTLGSRVVLDHRTDIYSLGATLYELVTHKPAFDAVDRGELLRQIAVVEPKAPRRVDPAIPPDLETIILKSMSKDAASRYASAQHMADDLRRFLERKPIAAKRPSLIERGRKWAARHAALVSMVAGGLAVIAMIAAAATLLTLRAYRSEARHRAAAVANLRVAADSIDGMLSRVADDRYFHGDLAHAETVAADAANFYDKLLLQSDDPELRLRAAHAQAQVADVWVLAGRQEQALQAYHRSMELVRPLIAEFPDEPEYLAARAFAYQGVGESQWRLYKVYNAVEPFQQAAADYQLLVDRFPREPSYRQGLANALGNLGAYAWISNQWDDADGYFQQAAELTSRLPDAINNSPTGLSNQAGLISNQALLARSRGDVPKAEKLLAEAVALQQRSRSQWPDNPVAADALYRHYWNLAETSLGAGRPEAAAQAVDMLVGAFPHRLDSYVDGARQLVSCGALAERATWKGSGKDPGEYYQRAHTLVDQARELVATAPEAPNRTPEAVDRFAWLLLTCEVESFRDPQLALELAQGVVKEVPERGGVWFTLALALYRAGDWQAADEAVEKSIDLGKADAFDWSLLAMIRFQQGRHDDARQWQKKASDWIAEHQSNDQGLITLTDEAYQLVNSN